MTLTRYQIRNEYGLADKELYESADKEDPEALLEGASMAGLVGVLRQLGDLAEFAAEVFHGLHQELMTTAARGHGLAMRLQQVEAEFPSVEIPILSQTHHSNLFYEPGLEWQPNLQTEENVTSPRNLPRCIMDSYEECRGPPQLFLLDKFDVVGSGSCLKRYSDPSLFKTLTGSAIVATSKRKLKKKVSHATSGETLGDSRTSHSKLHQLFSLEHVDNVHENPEIHVKLKRRQLNGPPSNSSYGTGYMEKFLKNSSPYCERVHGTLDQSSPAIETEVREDLPAPSLVYPNDGDSNKDNKRETKLSETCEVFEVGRDPMVNISPEVQPQNLSKLAQVPLDASVFSAETESEISLSGLVEYQLSSIESLEPKYISSEAGLSIPDSRSSLPDIPAASKSGCLLPNLDVWTFENSEDLSLAADAQDNAVPKEDETNSQDGSSMNTDGHGSTFEISSGNGSIMSDIPGDIQTGKGKLSVSSCQEEALDNPDLVETSLYFGQEDPEPMSIAGEPEVSFPDTQRNGTCFSGDVDHDDQICLISKAREIVPEIDLENISDPQDSRLGTQEYLSPEYCTQSQDQGQESPSEIGSPEPFPCRDSPQDVLDGVQDSPSEETLTCDEKIFPSNVTDTEALHSPPHKTFTSSNGHISESALSVDPTDQEICLDESLELMVPFSMSLHDTPQEDLDITPPLPPLPPTQWWMGKLIETETQFSLVTSFAGNGNNSLYTHRDEDTHNGSVQETEAGYPSEASVEAVSTAAQTTLNESPEATGEQSSSTENGSDIDMHIDESTLKEESFASVSIAAAEDTLEEESAEGLETDWRTEAMALEWFSQNLREHNNPNPAKLQEEPQLDQNEKAGKHQRDKDSFIIGIDRSMLRKVPERDRTQVGARVDENDSLLHIIRSKSFNLRPADASVRPNFQVAVPKTNLKVAAILEKANTLRQAMVGSDEDHDSDSWSE